MPYLPSTPRPSISNPLERVYTDMRDRGVSRGTPDIRAQLLGRNTRTYAWGQSVLAGSPSYASQNFINGTRASERLNRNDGDQRGFTPFTRGDFTARGLDYARNELRHSNRQYYA